MSICKSFGKDKLILVAKKDHETGCKYPMPPPVPNEKRYGVIKPDGSINWTCPCLGGLPYGPCGYEFRQFFSCLHSINNKSTEDSQENHDEMKARECFPKFSTMKECFSKFPKLYPPEDDDDEDKFNDKLQNE